VCGGDWPTVAVRSDGSVCAAGNNTAGQCEMEDWHRVRAVSTGYLHTLGLLDNGTVRAAGRPEFWSGIESWTDITAVAAGSYHSVGLRADGTVVAAGRSEAGQCDVGRWHDIVAIAAGAAHTVGLRADGGVVATGSNSHGQLEVGACPAG